MPKHPWTPYAVLCGTELFPVHRAFSSAQSFFQCTELFPVHRAFSSAQSFFQCTELSAVPRAFFLCTEPFPVHRAFCRAQSFPLCTELSVVHRAFSCAQSFFLCTELFPVHRALGAKACHPDQRFCRWKLLFYQQPCAKAKEFSTFCKVVKQKGEGKPTFSTRSFPLSLFIYPKLCSFGLLLKMRCIFFTEQSFTDQGSSPGPPMPVFCVHRASFWHRKSHLLCKRLVPKLQNSAKPNSGDSLPVLANETGGLGLWLGALGRSRLYRCQSTPGPPMPCFVAQSFVLAAFATLVCQRNCGFSLQRHKT